MSQLYMIYTKKGNSTLVKSLPPTDKYLFLHMVQARYQSLLHVDWDLLVEICSTKSYIQ